MRAVQYQQFGQAPRVVQLPDPTPSSDGVVIQVKASGICLSDWHGWIGHDPDIRLPHVPGHELSGVVVAAGEQVSKWRGGERVTLPFVGGCGHCSHCLAGQQQVCDHQFQPGFTHWGSFAEFTAIDYADQNLVRLPDSIDDVTAATLGCRLATSFRAIVAQGRVEAGQWVAVHGCGGVGLSAIMIAAALGARVLAVDISEQALQLAGVFGAVHCINARQVDDVAGMIRELTAGGAHVSVDALGDPAVVCQSIECLKKRGRHVQVGLITAAHGKASIPLAKVIANELEIVGSHGMQAYRYIDMLKMIEQGRLQPQKLISRTVDLTESIAVLTSMDRFSGRGITVIDTF